MGPTYFARNVIISKMNELSKYKNIDQLLLPTYRARCSGCKPTFGWQAGALPRSNEVANRRFKISVFSLAG